MLRRACLPLNASSDAPRNAGSQRSSPRFEAQAAFFPLPARMHAVQTRTCFLTPATTARTRFKFGFHRRRRVLFAWLITFPKCGALPQNSHFSAIFLPASVFIWAWIYCSKCRQTKLLILADPLPPAKCAFWAPDGSTGYAFVSRMVSWDAPFACARFCGSTCFIPRLQARHLPSCSSVRDSLARHVPVTAPITLKLQGLSSKRASAGRAYHCWQSSPNLTCPLACAKSGALARPMNDSLKDISRAPQPAPLVKRPARRESTRPKRLPRHNSFLAVLAALSTVAGYEAARFKNSGPNWLLGTQLLTSTGQKSPALVPASNPGAPSADVEAISHLVPQQQAERLLKLAIDRPDQALGLIHRNLDSWRGRLEDTDPLFNLVLAALDSNDPRVPAAAFQTDLVAHHLYLSPHHLPVHLT